MSLGKALSGIPPSLCGRQVVGPSSLPVVFVQSEKRLANQALAHTHTCNTIDSFLNDVIEKEQSGFIKARNIRDNIR